VIRPGDASDSFTYFQACFTFLFHLQVKWIVFSRKGFGSSQPVFPEEPDANLFVRI
jgi:hypothetical protein